MRLKIYGERHTGTKFLRTALNQHGGFDIWPGTFVELTGFKVPPHVGMETLSETEKVFVREAYIDDRFSISYEMSLGWKHSAVDVERLRHCAVGDTKFIVIAKHPLAWVMSFYRNPQHNLLSSNKSSIEEFVKMPWLTVRRDHLPAILPSVISLWNLKYAGYLRLAENYRVCIVKYEDLILREDAAARLADFCEMKTPLKLPERVPSHNKSLRDYQSYYLEERWRQEAGDVLFEAVGSRVDLRTMELLSYRM